MKQKRIRRRWNCNGSLRFRSSSNNSSTSGCLNQNNCYVRNHVKASNRRHRVPPLFLKYEEEGKDQVRHGARQTGFYFFHIDYIHFWRKPFLYLKCTRSLLHTSTVWTSSSLITSVPVTIMLRLLREFPWCSELPDFTSYTVLHSEIKGGDYIPSLCCLPHFLALSTEHWSWICCLLTFNCLNTFSLNTDSW